MPKLKESFVKSIFATDAVGFSKLVSNNEYETLASLKECLQIISHTVISSGGRIFHSAGDSVLAEFDNSDDALSAALTVQEQLASGISGLFVVWDTPCVDVIRKLSKRNLTLPISTVDLGQEVTINLAQGGNIIGISSQRPFQQGETAAKTIITSLLDRGCPDWVALPGLKVSSSNVIESYQFIWRKPAPMDILSGLNITKTK